MFIAASPADGFSKFGRFTDERVYTTDLFAIPKHDRARRTGKISYEPTDPFEFLVYGRIPVHEWCRITRTAWKFRTERNDLTAVPRRVKTINNNVVRDGERVPYIFQNISFGRLSVCLREKVNRRSATVRLKT